MASDVWNCGPNGPKTVDELRVRLAGLARKRAGKQLIDAKFTRDHIYAGHSGRLDTLASKLAALRDMPMSSLMISMLDTTSQFEVLNWINQVSQSKLTYASGKWTLGYGSVVRAANSYKFATANPDAYRRMDRDDRIKKSRDWLTVSEKHPGVVCKFDDDGTPLIYHFDF